MIIKAAEAESSALMAAAQQLCLAARTAPKSKGRDLVVTAIVTGEDKKKIADCMRRFAEDDALAFFARDAANVENAGVLILLGSYAKPLGLAQCGYCGFEHCAALEKAGGICSFNSGDLGVAAGSMVSRAADLRIDNRLMYSAGRAAIELQIFGPDVPIVYGLPLSVSGKSPFFDRKV